MNGSGMTCPRCGSRPMMIEDDSPSFTALRFPCGYSMVSHMIEDRVRAGTCGSWMLRERLGRMARRFWPSGETWATAGVRAAVGGALLATEHALPEALQSWWHLAGRIMIIMAAWCLLAHAERQFTTHVRVGLTRAWRATKREATR